MKRVGDTDGQRPAASHCLTKTQNSDVFVSFCGSHVFLCLPVSIEGRCPAEFSSIPNQTRLENLTKVFKIT